MFDVISIGSATLDVFLQVPQMPFPAGEKLEVKSLVLASGGGGTNTAVGFSRLGLKAATLARCGWDFAGEIVRKELTKEGVEDRLLIQKEGEATDYSTILIGPDGNSTILVYRGATGLDKSNIDFKKLKTNWFCISGLEGNLDLLASLLKYALDNKIKVALNPGKREIAQKEKLLTMIQNIEVLIVNEEEEKQLGGLPQDFKGLAVVTKGAAGVRLTDTKKRILMADGFKMAMIDATGAGDGFNCGLVAGLIKGWPIGKALKLGIANGASVVTEIGAKPGLLYEKDVSTWLAKPLKMEWEKDAKN